MSSPLVVVDHPKGLDDDKVCLFMGPKSMSFSDTQHPLHNIFAMKNIFFHITHIEYV